MLWPSASRCRIAVISARANFADLVLLDLGKPYVVNDDNILYHCGWSPFNGYRFHSTVEMTLVNGQIAWQNGQVTDQILGKRLTFNR